ncbi:MAG: hypothetical protein ABI162_09950 [Luteolibacter sp.]
MSRILTNAISAGLIGTGVFAWVFAGRLVVNNSDFKVPLNPLGINGSPYGEVFAMAMQGPIETYFHGSMDNAHHHEEEETVQKTEPVKKADSSHPSLEARFQNLLTSLDNVSEIRTNPKSANHAQKLYLRRQVEDKLRFAYQLDPSHYANYNSLHFFLTEPELGTRPQLSYTAAKLAEDTIQYCLKQKNDPRPSLTAAGACTNVLELMLNDQRNPEPKFKTSQMREYITLLDFCLSRYVTMSQEWDRTNNWDLLSPQRITECEDRYTFIRRIRDADERAIRRIEGQTHGPQASN